MSVITLCGSARYEPLFKEWNERLTLKGHVVISLAVYPSDKGGDKDWYTPEVKRILDAVHKKKILTADSIVVINFNGYIGESTQSEIEYAYKTGKTIYCIEPVHARIKLFKSTYIEMVDVEDIPWEDEILTYAEHVKV